MKRLILGILIVAAIFYFIQPPTVSHDDAPKVYTKVEKTLEQKEESLTLPNRFDRIMNFQDEVQKAMNARVAPKNQVTENEIPEMMFDALVATEDKRFYSHPGVDVYGIFRAFYVNSLAGETVEGGSTITQQLVKNLFLSSQRTWTRKTEELVLALMMEHYYTKKEILTMYLNSVYFGNNYYGIKEATEGYFNEEPNEIGLCQAALLAGLPQAPTFYNPKANPIAAKAKREIVLELMLKQNLITKKDFNGAVNAVLLPSDKGAKEPLQVKKAS